MKKIKEPKTIKAMRNTFEALLTWVENDGDDNKIKELSSEFNMWLDQLFENDFFGTEGQCDPRGDRRD